MEIVRIFLIWMIVAVSAVLGLSAALLLLLHLTRTVKNRNVQKMREQILCLLSSAANKRRIKSNIHEMVNPGGAVDSLNAIHKICSNSGMIAITETAEELSGSAYEKLQQEAGGEWYGEYIRKVFDGTDEEATALAVKLIGALKLKKYTLDVVTQIYCCRTTVQMQHVGMLALCQIGAERDIVALCRDHTIASLLSFRTLEEIFSVYSGNLKKLCRKLITTASDPYLRRTCIKTIGEQQFEDLGELVLPHLIQGHINTRIDAARTLGQLKYEPALQYLTENASDPRWEMRAVVATALGRFGAEQHIDTLLLLLCDKEWWVRYRAAEVLARVSNTALILGRVEETGDKFAGEMMRFALDQATLKRGEVA